jgi:hypothetical protein
MPKKDLEAIINATEFYNFCAKSFSAQQILAGWLAGWLTD